MQPIDVEWRTPERRAPLDLYRKWGVLPGPWCHGAVLDLDRVPYEGVFQSGERLLLEVAGCAAGAEPVGPDRIRFSARLRGHPSTWLGRHEPTSPQPWRLWYRVEPGNGESERDEVAP